MRKKRAATHRKSSKKSRKKSIIQAASLASIAAFGMAQVLPSSHAAFTNTETVIDGDITLSFVFPETIQEMMKEIENENQGILKSKALADELLKSSMGAQSSEIARGYGVEIDKLLENAKSVQKSISEHVNGLHTHYYNKALNEANNQQSIEQVIEMIENEGIKPANEIMAGVEQNIKEIKGIQEQANKKIMELEEKERQEIAALLQKALEGLNHSNDNASQQLSKYKDSLDSEELHTLASELIDSRNDLQASITMAQHYTKELEVFINNPKNFTVEVREEAKQNLEKIQLGIASSQGILTKIKITHANVQTSIWKNYNDYAFKLISKNREDMEVSELHALFTDLSKSQNELQTVLVEAENYEKEFKEYVKGNQKTLSDKVLEEANQSHKNIESEIATLILHIEKIKIKVAEIHATIWKNSNQHISDLLAKYSDDMNFQELETFNTELFKSQEDLKIQLQEAEQYASEFMENMDGKDEEFTEEGLELAKLNYEMIQLEIANFKKNIDHVNKKYAEIKIKIEQEKEKQVKEAKKEQKEKQKQSDQTKKENPVQKDQSNTSVEVPEATVAEDTKIETDTIDVAKQSELSSSENVNVNGDE